MTRVVDASAYIHYLTAYDQQSSWVANQIRGRTMIAPEHFLAEAMSALRKLERIDEISEMETRMILKDLRATPIEYARFRPFAGRIWELRHNLTPYDAWYVALAEAFNAELITLDQRLASAPGIKCKVLIPDFLP